MITNTYKPYPEYQKHKRIDKIRNRFVGGLSHMFFHKLETSPQLKALEAIGKNTGYSAAATFMDVIRQCVTVHINDTNRQHRLQFRVMIKATQLSDLLANTMDGSVIANARRRNPNKEAELAFVGECLDLPNDIDLSFIFDRDENKIHFLKSATPIKHRTWIEDRLTYAINTMDDSIHFALPEEGDTKNEE